MNAVSSSGWARRRGPAATPARDATDELVLAILSTRGRVPRRLGRFVSLASLAALVVALALAFTRLGGGEAGRGGADRVPAPPVAASALQSLATATLQTARRANPAPPAPPPAEEVPAKSVAVAEREAPGPSRPETRSPITAAITAAPPAVWAGAEQQAREERMEAADAIKELRQR